MNSIDNSVDDGGPWDVGMEKSPRVDFDNDKIVIKNFRNFRYQCDGSHEEKYETRTINVADLETADYIVVPFAKQPDLAHTMMSFGTRDGQRTVVSIEARRRLNQKFGIIKGIFGFFPLMYVIADERDAIGQRTELRGDDVYLYRSNATPEQVQAFFRCVMERVEKLSHSRETYNTITNNCLTNIRYHINQIWPGRVPWNWRILINGHSDYLAYKLGLLESEQSFRSTQQRASITAKAKGNLKREDFSALIRS
ncbi:DUF4105 domain-containing protein [Mariniblastus sp.]|nr:DUF4105 domain-containing protein [Mariniblastus sp.]